MSSLYFKVNPNDLAFVGGIAATCVDADIPVFPGSVHDFSAR